MRDDRIFITVFLLFGGVIVIFLILPLVGLFWSVGPEELFKALRDQEVYSSIWLTLKIALYAVIFVSITGIPLAYLIARYEFWGKSFLEALLDIPVMVPHTAAGIALLVAFGNGYMHDLLQGIGLGFVDAATGVMAAMMFLSAPFFINGAKEGFRKVDTKYEKVARTLGAGQMRTFFDVSLPAAKSDIINGALMMWSRALGEFGAVVIIAYHPMVAPVLIYDRFNSYGLRFSAPVAAAMILVSIVVFLGVRRWNRK